MLTDLVRRKLEETFADSAAREQAQAALSGLGEALPEVERVMLAVLKLGGGDVSRLLASITAAQLDYRDVLAWAEYPEQMALGPGADAERLAEARARDRDQYLQWLTDSPNTNTPEPVVAQQSPELEVLDQLLGGDLGLAVVRALFSRDGEFAHAIQMMLAGGEVQLLDGSGSALPHWKCRTVLSDSSAWARGTPYRLSLTADGARRV